MKKAEEGDESTMAPKGHGTSKTASVQENLRWNCDRKLADEICNFNRHYAENSGYFETTSFLQDASKHRTVTFYDSNTGIPLFSVPRGRSMEDFLLESQAHGWLSFRDEEVEWSNIHILPDGEAVSVAGTHLGRKWHAYLLKFLSRSDAIILALT